MVAAPGIETHHQRRVAEPPREMIDVIGQVVAAGFLARLDQDDTAGMRHPLLAQCQKSAQRAEHRVSVIRPAAAIELVAFETRDPRAVSLPPSDHLGLLVEMAVEQHAVFAFSRDLYDNARSAAG